MSTKFALPPFLLLLLGLWTPPSLNAVLAQQPLGFTTENQPPKLVVAITVDQMRADYLTRYAKGFGDHLGFLLTLALKHAGQRVSGRSLVFATSFFICNVLQDM